MRPAHYRVPRQPGDPLNSEAGIAAARPRARVSGDFNAWPNYRVLLLLS